LPGGDDFADGNENVENEINVFKRKKRQKNHISLLVKKHIVVLCKKIVLFHIW
jgi:hypothetical protein